MSFNWDGGRESQQTKVKEEEEGGENEILGWNSRSNKTPSARIFAYWMKPMQHPQLFSMLMDRPPLCLNPIGRCFTGSSSLEWIPFTATSRLDTAQLDNSRFYVRTTALHCFPTFMIQLSYVHTTATAEFSGGILYVFCGVYYDCTEIPQAVCFFLYFSLPPSSIWSTSIRHDSQVHGWS